MAQSPDAATIKRYKDLLVHYSPADGQMTKAMATPYAREWLQADKLVDQSVTNLEALQQELRDTGVSWMEGFAQMNTDELDTLWEHADKGFRAYEVCQLSSGIEMFCESIKHYDFDGKEEDVREAMRYASTSDRNTFLVNHARKNQQDLFNLSWRIMDRRAKMLDAERTIERFKRYIEDGKKRKADEERRFTSNTSRSKALFNKPKSTQPRSAISMFTSPVTPTTAFDTTRNQSVLTKLDREISKEFVDRFKEGVRMNTGPNSEPSTEDEDTEGYDEEELLNYTE